MAMPLAAVTICGLALALVANAGRVQGDTWWEVVLFGDAPPQLRFTVGVTAVLLLFGMVRLLRPARIRAEAFDEAARERLAALGAAVPARADAVLWGEAGRAGFAFTRQDGLWIAHGDPAGERRDAINAIWRFRDLCERNGARPAFLGIGSEHLRIYADTGLETLPDPARPGRFIACDAGRDFERLTRS
jgi:phosphatidylglycerol lysyltransferase